MLETPLGLSAALKASLARKMELDGHEQAPQAGVALSVTHRNGRDLSAQDHHYVYIAVLVRFSICL